MAELVKTIKPKRLDIPGVQRRIETVLQQEGEAIAKEYRKTVATWANKPKFEVLTDTTGGSLIIIVGPTGNADAVKHFVWTDEGTKPHIIRAKNAPRLAFRTGFTAKTKARVIGSGQSSVSGELTRPLVVNHPGTEAREFTQTIMSATRRKRIAKRLIDAARVEAK